MKNNTIHTAEYRAEIKPSQYLGLLAICNKGYDNRAYSQKYTTAYQDYGFTHISIIARFKEYRVTGGAINYDHLKPIDIMEAYITIRVNFTKLLCKERTSLLYNGEENQIESNFNYIRDHISTYIPTFEKFQANRIDYTIDIQTEYVNEYIHNLKKSGLNNYFSSGGDYRTSLSEHTKSYSLNIYDKQTERKDRQIKELFSQAYSNITAAEIQKTTNTLRVEIQCKKPKLRLLTQYYDILTEWETSRETIINTLQRNFYCGNIYRLDYLKNTIIPLAFKRPTTQEKVSKLITYISQKNHTVRQAINNAQYITGIQPDTARKLLRQLNRYKADGHNNTCVIPLRARTKAEYLPNIIQLIDIEYDEQTKQII